MTFETTGMIRIDKLGCRLEEQVFSSCMNPPNYEKLRRGYTICYHENNCLRSIGKEEFYLGSEKVTLRVIPKRTLPLIIWPFFFLYQFDNKKSVLEIYYRLENAYGSKI